MTIRTSSCHTRHYQHSTHDNQAASHTMSVRVVARIRPLLDHELDKDIIVTAGSSASAPENTFNVVKIPSPKNGAEEFSFTFNGVYDQTTSQEDLFASEGTLLPNRVWSYD